MVTYIVRQNFRIRWKVQVTGQVTTQGVQYTYHVVPKAHRLIKITHINLSYKCPPNILTYLRISKSFN